MLHKDIRIEFDCGHYEAVGFLGHDEPSVDGKTMMERTSGGNSVGIGNKDYRFLREHRKEFPTRLRPYCLVTNRRIPGHSRSFSCFVWDGSEWCESTGFFDDDWGESVLVLCRV